MYCSIRILVCVLLLFFGCTRKPPPSSSDKPAAPLRKASPLAGARLIQHDRSCLGTKCTLVAYASNPDKVKAAFEAALAEVSRLDRLMTTWLSGSDVSRVNSSAGSGKAISVDPETLAVLRESLWIARKSDGAFDITVGAFKGLWKFDEDNDGTIPPPSEVEKRVSLVDYRDLLLTESPPTAQLKRPGQRITLGGIAKGWIVDRAVATLKARGLEHFVFRAGGDLFASGRRGDRAWRVGIQDPRAPSSASEDASFAVLELENSAFNTSGDYERYVLLDGHRYHHILNPASGLPVEHTRSVTVLAATAFLADTLDTALFVMGAERAMELVESTEHVEAVVVDSNNKVHVSRGLIGRLKITRPPTDAL